MGDSDILDVGGLSEPLLSSSPCGHRIFVQKSSQEWDGIGDSDSSNDNAILEGKATDTFSLPRQKRYARMSKQGEAESVTRKDPSTPSVPLYGGLAVRVTAYMVAAFLHNILLLLSLVVSLFDCHMFLVSLVLGPTLLQKILVELYLSYTDGLLQSSFRKLRHDRAYARLAFFFPYVVVVLGCLFGYLLLRLKRHLCGRKTPMTLLAELDMVDQPRPDVDGSRLDCLLELCSAPFVLIPCLLIVDWCSRMDACMLLAFFVVSLGLFTAASIELDYNISQHVRERYGIVLRKTEWFQSLEERDKLFQALHAAARLTELCARVLTWVAGAVWCLRHNGWWYLATGAGFLDYLLGLAMLLLASFPIVPCGGSSPGLPDSQEKAQPWRWSPLTTFSAALALSLPLFAVDVARYVDEVELLQPARRLTSMCAQVRALEILVVIGLLVSDVVASGPDALEVAILVLLPCVTAAHSVLWYWTAPPSQAQAQPGARSTGQKRRSSSDLSPMSARHTRAIWKLFGDEVGLRSRMRPAHTLVAHIFLGGVGEQMERMWVDFSTGGAVVRMCDLAIVGRLGVGGFGKVLKVEDLRTGLFYALKLQDKGTAAKQAIREAQALRKSHEHPFIVGLVHIFQTSAHYALLMECCKQDLNTYIIESRVSGLPWEEASRYTACVTLALQYLHQEHIVFRDLKPENVLLTGTEDGDYAKLTDFGLAKKFTLETRLTRANSAESVSAPGGLFPSPVAGTAAFMAVEAWNPLDRPHGADNPNTLYLAQARDWYALGCCLLLMVLGLVGGSIARGCGKVVLLPVPGPQIPTVLESAVQSGQVSEQAQKLITSLTCEEVDRRARAEELHSSPLMKAAFQELETVLDRPYRVRSIRSPWLKVRRAAQPRSQCEVC